MYIKEISLDSATSVHAPTRWPELVKCYGFEPNPEGAREGDNVAFSVYLNLAVVCGFSALWNTVRGHVTNEAVISAGEEGSELLLEAAKDAVNEYLPLIAGDLGWASLTMYNHPDFAGEDYCC